MMTLREKQLELIKEIDKACRDNGIPYILSEFTAYSAVSSHDFYPEIATPTLAMRCRDAMRLKKLLASQGRRFEDALSNRKLDKFVLRYSDPDTFFYNAEEMNSFSEKGIGVDIELIRGVPGRGVLNRLLVLMEDTSVVLAKLEAGSSVWTRPLWALFGAMLRGILSLIYRSKRLEDTKRLRICRYPHKSVEFSAGLLKKRGTELLCGCTVSVPQDIDSYLKCEIDYDWARKRIKRGNPDFHLAVWDARHPAGDYASVGKERCRVNWFRWLLVKAQIRSLRQKLERYWEILLCTGDRFRLARLYLPQKDRLIKMHADGEREALREAMTDAVQATERHMVHGIGFCIDKELLNITLEILEEEHGAAYAARVRSAVPPVFLNPPEIGMN